MTDRPFSIGYNGHAKSCDCEQCAAARVYAMDKLWRANGRYAEPKTADATIFVRSHFRRGKKHLSRFPNTRGYVKELIAKMRKDKGKDE